MSYAVIRTGGKQYRVQVGDTLRVEKLEGEVGGAVAFGEILMTGGGDAGVELDKTKLGAVKVSAKIVGHGRGKKVHTLKWTRRKGYQKRIGHRQDYTEVLIQAIG